MAPPASVLDDRYRLDDRIAEGGMGEVWRATDLLLTRPVAVKLLHPAYTGDEAGLARFRTEAQYAGSLSHPNIAHIYDYWGGEPPGQPYLVMELVDGPSLAGLLADGPLSPERTLEIISQAAAGLEAAHAAGLVHRDIKPGNLLVSKTGQIKIADFGIASAVGSAPVTRTGEVIGTPAYLSPEQSAGRSATPASDLYALGIVAYQCLAGEPPFQGEPLAVALAHQERNLPPLPASVPLAVAAFVSHLAAKDPDARPASAGEVALRAERLRATVTGGSPALTWLPAASAQPATPTMADLQAQAGCSPADLSPADLSPAGLRLAGTSQAGAALAAAGQPESTAVPAAAAVPVAATAASGPAGAAGATQAAQTEGTAAPADTASAPQTAGTPAVTALARSGAHDTQEAAASLVPAGPAYAAGAGRPRDRGNPAAWVIGGRARTRTALAAAAVVVFALAGWALSSLPAASLPHRDPPPVPTARASAPATDPGVVPAGTPPPHTVATPSPDTAPSRPARPAVAAASPSPSPSTARAPTPSTTPSPSTSAGTPTPSAPSSPTPSTSATPTPSASPG